MCEIVFVSSSFHLGNTKIDRNLGNQCFEELVSDGLLQKNYFVLTNTLRPINCFVKVLPKNETETKNIKMKLDRYNIDLIEFSDKSLSIGVTPPYSLSLIGQNLLSQHPYNQKIDIPSNLLKVNRTDTSQVITTALTNRDQSCTSIEYLSKVHFCSSFSQN